MSVQDVTMMDHFFVEGWMEIVEDFGEQGHRH